MARLGTRLRTKEGRPSALALAFACLTLVVPCLAVVAPWWDDPSLYGFHDWDVQTAHRHLAVTSLTRYGEWPGWNPYACGGFPAWGYVESGTNVVSPWLPFYLLFDIRTAIRLEVLGMATVGAVGTYLVAGRFTESIGARASVVALFAVNGRWALQAASGHTWHLAYALLPWALWAFERARSAPVVRSSAGSTTGSNGEASLWGISYRHCVGLGVVFALLVYAGGIYPLPHTVLVLSLWAALVSIHERSARPIAVLAASGILGVGLSAPKLFPMIATFDRAPRLIESSETLSLGAFWTLLTSREQGFFDRPAEVAPYGWHEWGMYISSTGAILLALAFVLVTGRRESLLKVVGATLVILGFGAFHEHAPWTLLHEHVPVFRSQHVPSRFLYPAVLVLGLVLAAGLGALVARVRYRFPYADAIVAALAFMIACDVASVAKQPMEVAMRLRAPEITEASSFHFEQKPPFQYRPRDWAGPMYLAMLGNTGVIECYGTPPFEEKGAIARSDRRYRGEVYIDSPSEAQGDATLEAWSPNGATIAVRGAPKGARLVYNMNHDPGWHATIATTVGRTRAPAVPDRHRVSVLVPEGDSTVELRYRPPGLGAGVIAFLLTAFGAVALGVHRRRAGRARSAPPEADA